MTEIVFRIGQIADYPHVADVFARYNRELARRKMPSTWPASNLYYFAALFYDNEVMSVLFYAPIYAQREIYSIGAYTRPSWRRLGLYGFIWKTCLNRWRKSGDFDVFLSGFNKKNLISQNMQISQGRELYQETDTHIRTRICLKPTGQETDLTTDDLKAVGNLIARLSG
jgi:hypothetical protein